MHKSPYLIVLKCSNTYAITLQCKVPYSEMYTDTLKLTYASLCGYYNIPHMGGLLIINSIATIFHSTLLEHKPLFMKCVKLIESVKVQYTHFMINMTQ